MGTASSITIAAYRLTSSPVVDSARSNSSLISGSRPTGSISVVTAVNAASASTSRPTRAERPLRMLQASAHRRSILGGRVNPGEEAGDVAISTGAMGYGVGVVAGGPSRARHHAPPRRRAPRARPAAPSTETVERLRAAELLTESRAPIAGPGRPTTILEPHERGPLVIVVELRARQWVVSLGDLAGRTTACCRRAATAPTRRRSCSARSRARSGRRIASPRAGSVPSWRSSPAPSRDTRLVQTHRARLDRGRPRSRSSAPSRKSADVALLAGNDATLGGVAEARTGAARRCRGGAAPPRHRGPRRRAADRRPPGPRRARPRRRVRPPSARRPRASSARAARTAAGGERWTERRWPASPANLSPPIPEAYARQRAAGGLSDARLRATRVAAQRRARARSRHRRPRQRARPRRRDHPERARPTRASGSAPDAFVHAYQRGPHALPDREAPPPIRDSTHGDSRPRGAAPVGHRVV